MATLRDKGDCLFGGSKDELYMPYFAVHAYDILPPQASRLCVPLPKQKVPFKMLLWPSARPTWPTYRGVTPAKKAPGCSFGPRLDALNYAGKVLMKC